MTGLVEFIRARLDEDERLARRAGSLCGCHPPALVWRFSEAETDGRVIAVGDEHQDVRPRGRLARRWSTSYNDMFAAEHIARHDPARVLREVAAKRQQIAALEARRHFLDDREWYGCKSRTEDPLADGDQPTGEPCTCGRDDEVRKQLALMALAWSDHPDYRPEWAP